MHFDTFWKGIFQTIMDNVAITAKIIQRSNFGFPISNFNLNLDESCQKTTNLAGLKGTTVMVKVQWVAVLVCMGKILSHCISVTNIKGVP